MDGEEWFAWLFIFQTFFSTFQPFTFYLPNPTNINHQPSTIMSGDPNVEVKEQYQKNPDQPRQQYADPSSNEAIMQEPANRKKVLILMLDSTSSMRNSFTAIRRGLQRVTGAVTLMRAFDLIGVLTYSDYDYPEYSPDDVVIFSGFHEPGSDAILAALSLDTAGGGDIPEADRTAFLKMAEGMEALGLDNDYTVVHVTDAYEHAASCDRTSDREHRREYEKLGQRYHCNYIKAQLEPFSINYIKVAPTNKEYRIYGGRSPLPQLIFGRDHQIVHLPSSAADIEKTMGDILTSLCGDGDTVKSDPSIAARVCETIDQIKVDNELATRTYEQLVTIMNDTPMALVISPFLGRLWRAMMTRRGEQREALRELADQKTGELKGADLERFKAFMTASFDRSAEMKEILAELLSQATKLVRSQPGLKIEPKDVVQDLLSLNAESRARLTKWMVNMEIIDKDEGTTVLPANCVPLVPTNPRQTMADIMHTVAPGTRLEGRALTILCLLALQVGSTALRDMADQVLLQNVGQARPDEVRNWLDFSFLENGRPRVEENFNVNFLKLVYNAMQMRGGPGGLVRGPGGQSAALRYFTSAEIAQVAFALKLVRARALYNVELEVVSKGLPAPHMYTGPMAKCIRCECVVPAPFAFSGHCVYCQDGQRRLPGNEYRWTTCEGCECFYLSSTKAGHGNHKSRASIKRETKRLNASLKKGFPSDMAISHPRCHDCRRLHHGDEKVCEQKLPHDARECAECHQRFRLPGVQDHSVPFVHCSARQPSIPTVTTVFQADNLFSPEQMGMFLSAMGIETDRRVGSLTEAMAHCKPCPPVPLPPMEYAGPPSLDSALICNFQELVVTMHGMATGEEDMRFTTCLLCTKTVQFNYATSSCGRDKCPRVCLDCMKAWYGGHVNGELVQVRHLSCPFCYGRPLPCVSQPYITEGLRDVDPSTLRPHCHYAWCITCKKLGVHSERACVQDPGEVKNWKCEECRKPKPWVIKPCPGCETPFSKNGHCNHITCQALLPSADGSSPRPCGAHWCFQCGESKDPNGHLFTAASCMAHLWAAHGSLGMEDSDGEEDDSEGYPDADPMIPGEENEEMWG